MTLDTNFSSRPFVAALGAVSPTSSFLQQLKKTATVTPIDHPAGPRPADSITAANFYFPQIGKLLTTFEMVSQLSTKMFRSRNFLCVLTYALLCILEADARRSSQAVSLLDSHEAEGRISSGEAKMSQQQIASMVGTKIMNHLKSIRITKPAAEANTHPTSETSFHSIHPVVNSLLSKATNVLPVLKSAAPRDAKLADDTDIQVSGIQVFPKAAQFITRIL